MINESNRQLIMNETTKWASKRGWYLVQTIEEG